MAAANTWYNSWDLSENGLANYFSEEELCLADAKCICWCPKESFNCHWGSRNRKNPQLSIAMLRNEKVKLYLRSVEETLTSLCFLRQQIGIQLPHISALVKTEMDSRKKEADKLRRNTLFKFSPLKMHQKVTHEYLNRPLDQFNSFEVQDTSPSEMFPILCMHLLFCHSLSGGQSCPRLCHIPCLLWLVPVASWEIPQSPCLDLLIFPPALLMRECTQKCSLSWR